MSATIAADTNFLASQLEGRAEVAGLLSAVHRAHLSLLREKIPARLRIGNSNDLEIYLRTMLQHESTEQIHVLYLNTKNELLHEFVSQGALDAATLYVRDVLYHGMQIGAAGLILIHNHPSGDPTPSAADKDMTRKLALACKLVDMSLHDHLVVARSGVISFRREGIL
ncbi:JAB domain-containing protein [Sphingomonas sp. S2-65]|uniref:JAB domain-containing protein n=1 Tax=Sphingomonas sp. S2-65 TaxID=2903960 RepID=UPI001F403826|nr:JAB domain-containing protein [Sphingomonas sp. S2-65]UYY57031.1 hypothetical protein LZ586_10065 [Sphingomonas sp. S2-65]